MGAAAGVAGVTAALAVYGWRRRAEPGGRWFGALMLFAAIWAGVYAVGLAVPAGQTETRVAVEKVMFVGVIGVPVAWVAFAATYAGYWTDPFRVRRRVALLSVVPLVCLVGALTNSAHGLYFSAAEPVAGDAAGRLTAVVYNYEALFLVFTVYGWTLVLAGTVVLLRTAITADDLYTGQAVALAVGAVVPALSSVASVTGTVPVDGLDVTPFGLAVTGVALAYALAQTKFLDRAPATHRLGRAAVVENVSEGVVVVNGDGDVTDVNPVVESLVGVDRADLVGYPVERALAPVIADAEGDPNSVTDMHGETVHVGDDWFEVRVSALSNRADRSVGHVLTLRDVSDRRAREQRLQVMNRLLRHNFRNEVTVVHGFAELLEDRLDGREKEMAARVHEVGAELVERVEKAASVERVADLSDVEPDAVDLAALSREVVEEVDGVHDADVTVEVRGRPVLARVVMENAGMILRNLLENAVEHNDNDTPSVTVTVDGDDDWVEMTVADDGPGLPEHERAVLDLGRETELEHGSGLGLWLVYWCVQAADGEVHFEDNDPRGTVVRVGFPAVSPAEAASETVVPSGDRSSTVVQEAGAAEDDRPPAGVAPAETQD